MTSALQPKLGRCPVVVAVSSCCCVRGRGVCWPTQLRGRGAGRRGETRRRQKLTRGAAAAMRWRSGAGAGAQSTHFITQMARRAARALRHRASQSGVPAQRPQRERPSQATVLQSAASNAAAGATQRPASPRAPAWFRFVHWPVPSNLQARRACCPPPPDAVPRRRRRPRSVAVNACKACSNSVAGSASRATAPDHSS